MYQAPIVIKAFRILELVATKDKLMTISDLSRELGINKSRKVLMDRYNLSKLNRHDLNLNLSALFLLPNKHGGIGKPSVAMPSANNNSNKILSPDGICVSTDTDSRPWIIRYVKKDNKIGGNGCLIF